MNDLKAPTPSQLIAAANGRVHCSEGWVITPLGPELLEYADERAACLVNIGHPTHQRVRPIYGSESRSELFPDICEHLRMALPYLSGRFIVV